MKQKPQVGQMLYERIGTNLKPVTVKFTGRKYFKAGDHLYEGGEKTYRIDDWSCVTYCGASSRLYTSEQEYEDEKQSGILSKQIADCFPYGNNSKGLTLIQLTEIAKIIFTL